MCVIDQAQGQDGWILDKFFFCIFMDGDEVKVDKNAKKKKRMWPTSSYLDRTSLVNKGFIVWPKDYTKYLRIMYLMGGLDHDIGRYIGWCISQYASHYLVEYRLSIGRYLAEISADSWFC